MARARRRESFSGPPMPMPYDELGTHGGKGKLYPPERGGGGWSIGSPDRFTSGAFRSSQCTAMLCAAGLTLPPPPRPRTRTLQRFSGTRSRTSPSHMESNRESSGNVVRPGWDYVNHEPSLCYPRSWPAVANHCIHCSRTWVCLHAIQFLGPKPASTEWGGGGTAHRTAATTQHGLDALRLLGNCIITYVPPPRQQKPVWRESTMAPIPHLLLHVGLLPHAERGAPATGICFVFHL